MTFEFFSQMAGTWGLVFLFVLASGAFLYALWPGNGDKFKRAAASPLHDDDAFTPQNQEATRDK